MPCRDPGGGLHGRFDRYPAGCRGASVGGGSGGGRPLAVIEGGEATVTLPADHGVGGRNQQAMLVAVNHIAEQLKWQENLLIASLGTDGEDGPTDCAGALAAADSARELLADQLALARGIARCDSLPLLERGGGLICTGPPAPTSPTCASCWQGREPVAGGFALAPSLRDSQVDLAVAGVQRLGLETVGVSLTVSSSLMRLKRL